MSFRPNNRPNLRCSCCCTRLSCLLTLAKAMTLLSSTSSSIFAHSSSGSPLRFFCCCFSICLAITTSTSLFSFSTGVFLFYSFRLLRGSHFARENPRQHEWWLATASNFEASSFSCVVLFRIKGGQPVRSRTQNCTKSFFSTKNQVILQQRFGTETN